MSRPLLSFKTKTRLLNKREECSQSLKLLPKLMLLRLKRKTRHESLQVNLKVRSSSEMFGSDTLLVRANGSLKD